MSKFLSISLAFISMVWGASVLVAAPPPPDWWADPKREDVDRLFFKGSASGSSSEMEARLQAYCAAVREISASISAFVVAGGQKQGDVGTIEQSTNLVIGAEIAFESVVAQGSKWYAWLLVSYPKEESKKARKRAEEQMAMLQQARTAKSKPAERKSLLVLPVAFGRDSQEQFPEVVAAFRTNGYGNAIWQKLESLLYDAQSFEVVTLPTKVVAKLKDSLENEATIGDSVDQGFVPGCILVCNVNFLSHETQTARAFTVVKKRVFATQTHCKLWEKSSQGWRVAVYASSTAENESLAVSQDMSAQKAVSELLRRWNAR